jgi:chromate transporter
METRRGRDVYNWGGNTVLRIARLQRAPQNGALPPDHNVTTTTTDDKFAKHWKEIASCFLKLGLISYGGPSLMAMLQLEVQEKRQWVTRDRFLEALGLVNMLPGAIAVQLGIFLGYGRGGWRGGVLAGACVLLPGFLIMLGLTIGYANFGATPAMRGALYGLGPIVLAVFSSAVYGLTKSSIRSLPQALIAAAAAAVAAFTSIGTAGILLLAGGVGLFLFHSRKAGIVTLIALAAMLAFLHFAFPSPLAASPGSNPADAHVPGVFEIALFFFKVGALTFGGGLTIIAFIQEQVVNHLHWLTPQQFLDGLALGQFTPGPLVIVAAYVGYRAAGFIGAGVAAAAIFLPSFILVLAIYPVFDRIRQLTWIRATMKSIGPAVIGVIAVALVHLAPHAVHDLFTLVIVILAMIALLAWRIGIVGVVIAGAALGMVGSQAFSLPVA